MNDSSTVTPDVRFHSLTPQNDVFVGSQYPAVKNRRTDMAVSSLLYVNRSPRPKKNKIKCFYIFTCFNIKSIFNHSFLKVTYFIIRKYV
jgi:hypothetical protein